MKMIVGLGNPGGEYKKTRHNLGFMVIDELCKKLDCKVDKKKFNNRYTEVHIDNEKVLLVKPYNYMNNSGEAITTLMSYYKIDIEDLLVISDDLDLPCGKIRIRSEGSSAGHNGLKSLIKYLGSQEFKRIRIGIDKDPLVVSADYVLGKPTKEQNKLLKEAIKKASEAALAFIDCDFTRVMNEYNKRG